MDEQRFVNACRLRDEGKLIEACNEFVQIAESAPDPLDKAGVLLHAADTLETSGQYEAATAKLSAVRALMEDYGPPKPGVDERLVALELFLDFEDANLFWLRGVNPKGALKRFEAALRKYTLPLKEPGSRDFYEGLQIRRAFVLADLGRWKEALPILEGIRSPQEYKEGVAFYLGHCYVEAGDYHRAEEKLTEALSLGLPSHLEYRAHCELGTTYYYLESYSKAKEEFEKGADKADPIYIKECQIWKWLEMTCRALGLKAEAEHYARMATPS
jgi:tetratricopeptide (TPR) repeat protein